VSDCGNSISLILIDSKIVARSLSKTFVVFYIFYIASALLLRILETILLFFLIPNILAGKMVYFFFLQIFANNFLENPNRTI